MSTQKQDIPTYDLIKFRHVHREQTDSGFGYNNLDPLKHILGFELYSSEGLIGSVGPLKSDFYRISITVNGTLDMKIGLESFTHQPRTVSLTYPHQLFAKNNISPDAFGYYLLFSRDFLNELIPSLKMGNEFPFYDVSGTPLFRLNEPELERAVQLLFRMNEELQEVRPGRKKAVRMYLYLLLIELKRSYERQGLHLVPEKQNGTALVSVFRKLVSRHYLEKKHVADYADILAVSPKHLNKVVKSVTGQTASGTIQEMLLMEAMSLLRYTDHSVAEIGYKMGFSDPASFNRFFRTGSGQTPLGFRKQATSG